MAQHFVWTNTHKHILETQKDGFSTKPWIDIIHFNNISVYICINHLHFASWYPKWFHMDGIAINILLYLIWVFPCTYLSAKPLLLDAIVRNVCEEQLQSTLIFDYTSVEIFSVCNLHCVTSSVLISNVSFSVFPVEWVFVFQIIVRISVRFI